EVTFHLFATFVHTVFFLEVVIRDPAGASGIGSGFANEIGFFQLQYRKAFSSTGQGSRKASCTGAQHQQINLTVPRWCGVFIHCGQPRYRQRSFVLIYEAYIIKTKCHPIGWETDDDNMGAMANSSRGESVVQRVSRILRVFDEEHQILSATQVAQRADLAISTAHRMVQSMVDEGLLLRTPDGKYRLGLVLWEL